MSKPKQRRNKEATIKKILDVSRKIIQEKGFFETTTNHIADNANVSIALIYKYFPKGKEDIIRDISIRQFSNMFRNGKIPKVSLDNFTEVAKKMIYLGINQHKENINLSKGMEIAILSGKSDFSDFIEQIMTSVNPVHELFKHLIQFENVEIKNYKQLSHLLNQTIDCIIHRYIHYNTFGVTEEVLVDYILDLILKHITIKK